MRPCFTVSLAERPQSPNLWRNVGTFAEDTAVFDKISRSWSLAGQCWEVLKEDPKLLIFPLLSSAALLVLLASFALPVFALYHGFPPGVAERGTAHHHP